MTASLIAGLVSLAAPAAAVTPTQTATVTATPTRTPTATSTPTPTVATRALLTGFASGMASDGNGTCVVDPTVPCQVNGDCSSGLCTATTVGPVSVVRDGSGDWWLDVNPGDGQAAYATYPVNIGPTLHGVTSATATAATTLALTLDATKTSADDVCIAQISASGHPTFTAPSGWIGFTFGGGARNPQPSGVCAGGVDSGNVCAVNADCPGSTCTVALTTVYYVKTGCAPSTWTWTVSGSSTLAGAAASYRNVSAIFSQASAFGAATASSTAQTAPASFTYTTGNLVVGMFAVASAGSPWTAPGGTTTRWDTSTTGLSITGVDSLQHPHGSIAAETATAAAAGSGTAALIALLPRQDVTLTIPLIIDTFPQSLDPTNQTLHEEALATLYSDTNPQALVSLGSDQTLCIHYRNLENECSVNSAFKYSECTDVSQCPPALGGNPGEADCAGSAAVCTDMSGSIGQPVTIAVTASPFPDSAPAAINLGLYVGGFQRAQANVWVGQCSGSTGPNPVNGKACSANAGPITDCNAICGQVNGCTTWGVCCTVSSACPGVRGADIDTPTFVLLGSTGTAVGSGGYHVQFDSVAVTNSVTDATARNATVIPAWPVSDSAPLNWNTVGGSHHYNLIDDTDSDHTSTTGFVDHSATTPPYAVDGDLSAVSNSGINKQDTWTLGTVAPGAGAHVVAVTARAVGRSFGSTAGCVGGANNGDPCLTAADCASPGICPMLAIGLEDALANSVSTTQAAAPTTYASYPGPILTHAPTGSGDPTLTSQRGLITNVGGTTLRVTNYVAEAEVAEPLDASHIPTTLTDQNGDGEITVGVIGDSQMDDGDMYVALVGALLQPDNILKCACGGRKVGDVLANITPILDGEATSNFCSAPTCQAMRGRLQCLTGPDVGATCAANTDCGLVCGDTGLPCATDADCPGDKCSKSPYVCGKHLDYALMMIAANNGAGAEQAFDQGYCVQRGCIDSTGTNLGIACRTSADCPALSPTPTCTDQSGPQNGDFCQVLSGTETNIGYSWVVTGVYCAGGDNIGACCSGVSCGSPVDCGGSSRMCTNQNCFLGPHAGQGCHADADCGACLGGIDVGDTCASNADCPGSTCYSASCLLNSASLCGPTSQCRSCRDDTDCAGDTPGTVCIDPGTWGNFDITDQAYGPGLCARGEPHAPECPEGLCLRPSTTAYLSGAVQQIVQAATARTGTQKVIFGLIGNSGPRRNTPLTCLYGPNTTRICTCPSSDTACSSPDCPTPTSGGKAPKCLRSVFWNHWTKQGDQLEWLGSWEGRVAATLGLPYIDLSSYFNRRAATLGVNPDSLLRDDIHFTTLGQHLAAELITACWTANSVLPPDGVTPPENRCAGTL